MNRTERERVCTPHHLFSSCASILLQLAIKPSKVQKRVRTRKEIIKQECLVSYFEGRKRVSQNPNNRRQIMKWMLFIAWSVVLFRLQSIHLRLSSHWLWSHQNSFIPNPPLPPSPQTKTQIWQIKLFSQIRTVLNWLKFMSSPLFVLSLMSWLRIFTFLDWRTKKSRKVVQNNFQVYRAPNNLAHIIKERFYRITRNKISIHIIAYIKTQNSTIVMG